MGLQELMEQWDDLPATEAVVRAWQDPGARAGTWHKKAREEVAYLMPLLARGLDRLMLELDDVLPSTDWRLWGWPEGQDPKDALGTDRLGARRNMVAGR